jgi:membrane dipeptidase
MNEKKMIVDISHLDDRGFYEVLDLSEKPHSCVKALKDSPRNLSDDQIKKIAQARGVIGINFYTSFLTSAKTSSVQDIVQHMDYICNLTGKSDFVGLGSDFDGIDLWPERLEDPSKMQSIAESLREKGYSSEDIEKIMGENLCRIFAENWK